MYIHICAWLLLLNEKVSSSFHVVANGRILELQVLHCMYIYNDLILLFYHWVVMCVWELYHFILFPHFLFYFYFIIFYFDKFKPFGFKNGKKLKHYPGCSFWKESMTPRWPNVFIINNKMMVCPFNSALVDQNRNIISLKLV